MNIELKPGIITSKGLIVCPDSGIILTERVSRMSVVIGVCGVNFCTFVSDGRVVGFDKEGEPDKVFSDSTCKVLKINSNIIMGTTGKFSNEGLWSVLGQRPDHSVLTMAIVHKEIMRYFEKNYSKLTSRQYLLGGRDNKGNFCAYGYRYTGAPVPEITAYKPVRINQDISGFAVFAAAPDFECEDVLQKHLYSTMPWKDHNELVKHMKAAVTDLSHKRRDVGGERFTASIF